MKSIDLLQVFSVLQGGKIDITISVIPAIKMIMLCSLCNKIVITFENMLIVADFYILISYHLYVEHYLFFPFLDTDPCYPNPCQHNGNCLNDGRNAFKCNCTQGFKGYKCDSKFTAYIISLLQFDVPQGSVLDPINVLLHSNSITVAVLLFSLSTNILN